MTDLLSARICPWGYPGRWSRGAGAVHSHRRLTASLRGVALVIAAGSRSGPSRLFQSGRHEVRVRPRCGESGAHWRRRRRPQRSSRAPRAHAPAGPKRRRAQGWETSRSSTTPGTAPRPVTARWQHWQQHGNTPPSQIASGWFPARGPYSSSDPQVVRAQMREIASLGIRDGDRVVVGARLGRGCTAACRDAGGAWGRASSRAARRAVRRPDAGAARAGAPGIREPRVSTDFYIYDSTRDPTTEWRALNGDCRGSGSSPTRTCRARRQAGGSPASTPMTSTSTTARRSTACVRRRGCTGCCAHRRSGPATTPSARRATRASARGQTARRTTACGERAIRAAADVVTITSYNEWHEGTQIEPARAVGPPYASLRRRLRASAAVRPSAPTSTARRAGRARYRA